MKTLAYVIGILLIVLGIYYFVTPAGSLVHFVPGYKVGVTAVHIKHGLASILLGLAALAWAWFQGGPKSAHKDQAEDPS